MLPKKGNVLGPWLPTKTEVRTRTTTFFSSTGPETSTVTGPMTFSALSSVKPGLSRGHSPVTGGNDSDEASAGHAEWLGNTLNFSGQGRQNYYYIPAVVDRVSFCVLLPDTFAIGGYIISDNYGGCEYHEAINPVTRELALLHVYRGSAGLAKYTLGPNWQLKRVLRSNEFVVKIPTKTDNPGQRDGSVLSVSYIPPCRLWKDFVIQSDFICVKAGLITHAMLGDLRDHLIS